MSPEEYFKITIVQIVITRQGNQFKVVLFGKEQVEQVAGFTSFNEAHEYIGKQMKRLVSP